MDFIEKIEIYRLGALCGIYSKQELIKYLDKLIYDLDDIPCEIIEASMLSNKNINDISDKLIELTWQINDDKDLVNKQLLHTICERYYLKSISIEEGRLLFLTPIKGWELICAKYLEFIGLGLLLILFTSIGNMIIGGDSKLIIITSLSILLGVFILFILITSLSVIFKSYFSNTGICIVLTVVSMVIISGIISILELVTYFIFPSVYMKKMPQIP